jgi:hypothetical protein
MQDYLEEFYDKNQEKCWKFMKQVYFPEPIIKPVTFTKQDKWN